MDIGRVCVGVVVAGVLIVATDGGAGTDTDTIAMASPAFVHGGEIPSRFTCDGEDISPRLSWKDIPANAKSIALIFDDPDVPDPANPKRTWVHWVLYNIPASAVGLAEAMTPDKLPPGTLPGLNDWKRIEYGGPCPPIGKHRYFFKLFALSEVLDGLERPTAAELERAMHGKVVAATELVGYYERRK
jgi:Raf kinase inhibitor-like YbhB/YbcL family protein